MAQSSKSMIAAAPKRPPQHDRMDDSLRVRMQNYQRNQQWSKPGPYVTKLAPAQEKQFQKWVKENHIPWQDSPTADYDMRGFWLAQQQGNKQAVRSAANGHFPDTWKTPYDATFSNQSMYATPEAPHWEGNTLLYTAAPLSGSEIESAINLLNWVEKQQARK